LKIRELKYVIIREFLADIKREFDRGDNEIINVAELKKIE